MRVPLCTAVMCHTWCTTSVVSAGSKTRRISQMPLPRPTRTTSAPRCLCRPDGNGIEMYEARLMNGYIVKRMPNTGSQHATACPSYELPADLSGLG